MADKIFAVVRVGRDPSDTYAAPMLGAALELAAPDPGSYVEHASVRAGDVGMARLMKPKNGWRRLVEKDGEWFNLGEGDELPNPSKGRGDINIEAYTHYVVNRQNQIESGWEFAEDAKDQVNELAAGNEYRVLTRAGLKRLGIDPADDLTWESVRGPRRNPAKPGGEAPTPEAAEFLAKLVAALSGVEDDIEASFVGRQLKLKGPGGRFVFGCSDKFGVTMGESPTSYSKWVEVVEKTYSKFNKGR